MGGSLESPGGAPGRSSGGRARAEGQKNIKIMFFFAFGRRFFEDVFACSRTVGLERAVKVEVDKIIGFHCVLRYFSHVRVVRAERGWRRNRGGRGSKSDPQTVRTRLRAESPKITKHDSKLGPKSVPGGLFLGPLGGQERKDGHGALGNALRSSAAAVGCEKKKCFGVGGTAREQL